jgi:tRNA(adenine34) deaminase
MHSLSRSSIRVAQHLGRYERNSSMAMAVQWMCCPLSFPGNFGSVGKRGQVAMVPKALPHRRVWPVTPALVAVTSFGKQEEDDAQNEEELKRDEHFMRLALEQAELAAAAGEVPVGAIMVDDEGQILAAAHNRTETDCDPTAHAEMICIRKASTVARGWRLLNASMYVTLEPCPMCAGAILQSRVRRVVYGARNPLLGADGSWVDLLRPQSSSSLQQQVGRPHPFHAQLSVSHGVLESCCGDIMRDFFRAQRQS